MKSEVIHGDCAEVLKRFAGKADLVLTSPPYGNLRVYGGHTFRFDDVAAAIVAALKPGGVLVWITNDAIVGGALSGTSFQQALDFKSLGLVWHQTLIWHKAGVRAMGGRRYYVNHEYMFVFANGTIKTFNPICDRRNQIFKTSNKRGRRRTDDGFIDAGPRPEYRRSGKRDSVWYQPAGSSRATHGGFRGTYDHPASFPFQLAADHIRSWSNAGDLVIDPMCGSGTAVDAARRLDRRYVGIDINERYVELTRERLRQRLLRVE